MKWSCGLQAIVEENYPLAELTWYRLGGAARYFFRPRTQQEVCQIVLQARQKGLPLKVLGVGANVLIRDEGFPGIVMQLDRQSFGQIQFEDSRVIAGSAAELPDLVRKTVDRGLAGLEVLAGIPGSVGGALRMNAGGKFGEIGPSVLSVTLVDSNGEVCVWSSDQVKFQYRNSNLYDRIVLEACFQLAYEKVEEIKARYKKIWDFKKQTQPFTKNNAGCTFKNPTGFKAGQLIDQAGLKGERCGGAMVSTHHANFIVAEPNTKTSDILNLTDRIRSKVREKFNVELELEIDVW